MKKIAAVALAFTLALTNLSISPPVYARAEEVTAYSDIEDSYAKEAILSWSTADADVLHGYGDGKFRPKDSIRKVDLEIIIDRLFGKPLREWENSPVVTREEAAKFIALEFGIEPLPDTEIKEIYSDHDIISPEYRPYVYALRAAQIHRGDGLSYNPKAPMTREAIIQTLDNAVSEIIDENSSNNTYDKTAVVRKPGLTLKDIVFRGDLIIGQGVGEGDVILDNVKVEGNLLVYGGGTNSIIIRGASTINAVVINKSDSPVRLKSEGNSTIGKCQVTENAQAVISGSNALTLSVAANANVTIEEGSKVTKIEIDGDNVTLTVDKGGVIEQVVIRGENANVAGEGSVGTVSGDKADSGKIDVPITAPTPAPTTPSGSSGSSGSSSSGNNSSIPTPTPSPTPSPTPTVIEYTVVFNKQGGSIIYDGKIVGTPKLSITMKEGATFGVTLPFAEPPNDKKYFMGWNTQASGKGTFFDGSTAIGKNLIDNGNGNKNIIDLFAIYGDKSVTEEPTPSPTPEPTPTPTPDPTGVTVYTLEELKSALEGDINDIRIEGYIYLFDGESVTIPADKIVTIGNGYQLNIYSGELKLQGTLITESDAADVTGEFLYPLPDSKLIVDGGSFYNEKDGMLKRFYIEVLNVNTDINASPFTDSSDGEYVMDDFSPGIGIIKYPDGSISEYFGSIRTWTDASMTDRALLDWRVAWYYMAVREPSVEELELWDTEGRMELPWKIDFENPESYEYNRLYYLDSLYNLLTDEQKAEYLPQKEQIDAAIEKLTTITVYTEDELVDALGYSNYYRKIIIGANLDFFEVNLDIYGKNVMIPEGITVDFDHAGISIHDSSTPVWNPETESYDYVLTEGSLVIDGSLRLESTGNISVYSGRLAANGELSGATEASNIDYRSQIYVYEGGVIEGGETENWAISLDADTSLNYLNYSWLDNAWQADNLSINTEDYEGFKKAVADLEEAREQHPELRPWLEVYGDFTIDEDLELSQTYLYIYGDISIASDTDVSMTSGGPYSSNYLNFSNGASLTVDGTLSTVDVNTYLYEADLTINGTLDLNEGQLYLGGAALTINGDFSANYIWTDANLSNVITGSNVPSGLEDSTSYTPSAWSFDANESKWKATQAVANSFEKFNDALADKVNGITIPKDAAIDVPLGESLGTSGSAINCSLYVEGRIEGEGELNGVFDDVDYRVNYYWDESWHYNELGEQVTDYAFWNPSTAYAESGAQLKDALAKDIPHVDYTNYGDSESEQTIDILDILEDDYVYLYGKLTVTGRLSIDENATFEAGIDTLLTIAEGADTSNTVGSLFRPGYTYIYRGGGTWNEVTDADLMMLKLRAQDEHIEPKIQRDFLFDEQR